ncbi:MAG TPA: hypothetical protein VF026_24450 [Ktedonobacteraceae bacterium]
MLSAERILPLVSFASALRRWITTGTSQGKNGAFHAWRDAASGTLSYQYPEISGYALTYLSGCHKGDAVGRRTVDWLVSRIGFNDLTAREQDGEAVYNFDLAMIATGLMSFGSKLENAQYVTTGLKLVDFIQDQLLSAGYLLPLSPAYPSSPRKSTWSTEGRAHLLKVVQCLLIAQLWGLPRTNESIAILMRSAGELQLPTGRFVTHPTDAQTFLHPHLYAAEGLWMWGTALGDSDAIERARMAIAWVWPYQLDTGGFPNMVDNTAAGITGVEQSDVTSQAVRLALLLDMQFPGLDQAIARIMQVSHGDEKSRAVLYRPTSADLHQNTWATIFASQALRVAISGVQVLPWILLA